MNIAEVIREAERVQKGAGISEFTRMYKKMLRMLKEVSGKIDGGVWNERR